MSNLTETSPQNWSDTDTLRNASVSASTAQDVFAALAGRLPEVFSRSPGLVGTSGTPLVVRHFGRGRWPSFWSALAIALSVAATPHFGSAVASHASPRWIEVVPISRRSEGPWTSTEESDYSEGLEAQIRSMFVAAREEIFEDGFVSDFSRNLSGLTLDFGFEAVSAVVRRVLSDEEIPEVVAEALKTLGRIRHPSSYLERRWALERSLFSREPRVRDGAATGLAFMDDPHAMRVLAKAIEREPVSQLRKDLTRLRQQLESTRRWLSSSDR